MSADMQPPSGGLGLPRVAAPRPDPDAEQRGLFPVIRRWAGVILAITAVFTLAGWAFTAQATPTYEARTTLLVGPLVTNFGTTVNSGRLAETYVDLVDNPAIIEPLARRVDVDRNLLYRGVRAQADAQTRFVELKAEAHTPEGAAEAATVAADLLTLRAATSSDGAAGQLSVVDPATPPSRPIRPRPDLIIPLAAVAGLLASVGIVMVMELVGDTAATTRDVDVATGVTTLSLTRGRRGQRGERSRAGEVVTTELELVRPHARCVVLAGVSDQDEGGPLALEVASTWAGLTAVTVIDAGPGQVTSEAGLNGHPGLREALAGDASVRPTTLTDTVEVLAVGHGVDEGSEGDTLDLVRARALLARVQADGRRVVVHTASPATSSVALGWARVADATVLVARRDRARRVSMADAATNLRAAGADLAFSVLQDQPRRSSRRRSADAREESAADPEADLVVAAP